MADDEADQTKNDICRGPEDTVIGLVAKTDALASDFLGSIWPHFRAALGGVGITYDAHKGHDIIDLNKDSPY